MKTMIVDTQVLEHLSALGWRLRHARIARNDSQARFAARIGVSIPTLRKIEQGDPSVQVGHWVNALWALDRLADLDGMLVRKASLFDAESAPRERKRASRPRARP